MASGKKFGGVKAHASAEHRARMSPTEYTRAEIQERVNAVSREIMGIVNEILGEENRGREEPDDRNKPDAIADDGLA